MSARPDAPITESRITSATHPARRDGAGFAAAAASFVAVFAAGAVLGRLSDHLVRQPVALAALAVEALGP